MTRLKKGRKVSLRKERERNHKITLNALIMRNKNITQETAIRNLNKIK